MNEWYEYKLGPEQSYAMRKRYSKQFRYYVWKLLQTPKSLRKQVSETFPNYIQIDKIMSRVKYIERSIKEKTIA